MAHVEHPGTPSPAAQVRATRGILATQALRLSVRVVTAAGLARMISPAEYGVFGMAALIHGLVSVFQDFGLGAFTLTRPQLHPAERTALFWLNAVIGAVLMIAVGALGPLAAGFFGEPALRPLLPAIGVAFLLNGLHSQLRAQLGQEQRFQELNQIEIVAFVLSSAVALGAAHVGWGYWALVALPITAELVMGIETWRRQRWRPGRWPRGFSATTALRFGAGVAGYQVLRYLQRNADQFFVGRWFGAASLGLYGRAYQLVTLPNQYAIDSLATWAVASLSRARTSPAALRALWRQLLNGLAHLTLPLATLLFCLPREFMRIAFGPEWTEGAGMLRALAIGLVAQPILAALTWLLLATERNRRLLAWSAVTLVLVLAGCVIAREKGPTAVATWVSYALLLAAGLWGAFGLRNLPVGPKDLFAAIFRPTITATIGGGITTAALATLPSGSVGSRFAVGSALIAMSWLIALAWPAVRKELSQHFLRRSR